MEDFVSYGRQLGAQLVTLFFQALKLGFRSSEVSGDPVKSRDFLTQAIFLPQSFIDGLLGLARREVGCRLRVELGARLGEQRLERRVVRESLGRRGCSIGSRDEFCCDARQNAVWTAVEESCSSR